MVLKLNISFLRSTIKVSILGLLLCFDFENFILLMEKRLFVVLKLYRKFLLSI